MRTLIEAGFIPDSVVSSSRRTTARCSSTPGCSRCSSRELSRNSSTPPPEEATNGRSTELQSAPARAWRCAPESDGLPTLFGHFSQVFNHWTEIDSSYEGRFMEHQSLPVRSPRRSTRTRETLKVLYDHGHDPQLGDKPLGPIDQLHEDKVGRATTRSR